MEKMQLIDAAKRIVSAALHHKLAAIPQSELTNELLTFEYADGKTPLLMIALVGQLQFVPTKFLTEENLTRRVFRNSTVLHATAVSGQLNLIPIDILTSRNLLMVDQSDETPLLNALHNRHLDQVPVAVLSENRNLRIGSKTLIEQLPTALQAGVEAHLPTGNPSLKKTTRILLVDADCAARAAVKLIVQHICGKRHIVAEAANGVEALGMLSNGQFDLVITALNMPGIRGDALAAEIKKISQSTPVILTNPSSPDLSPANCSADVVLTVPWRIAEIEDAFAKLLPERDQKPPQSSNLE